MSQTNCDIARAQIEVLFNASWTLGAVVRFHSVHKLLLMAHSPEAYRDLGRLVAEARALQHAAGYLKHHLDRAAKAELAAAIDDYRRERVSLAVPITLLRQHVREHAVSYLESQAYLG